jgi:hypothetical protein
VKTTLLVFIVLLHGCGGGGDDMPADDNHGYGWGSDATGHRGMQLREPGATTQTASDLERYAGTVSACAGIDAPPPPFVIVVPRDSLYPHIGKYLRDPPLIIVDEIFRDVAFAHEMVHYLLDYSTGSLDADHVSPLFVLCGFME